jgi:hypothetical protein
MSLLDSPTDHQSTDVPGDPPPPKGVSHDRPRRPVLVGFAALAVALALLGFTVVRATSTESPTDPPCDSAQRTYESGPVCDRLWDRVRASGLPEHAWAAAARDMGLLPRGEWISDNGLYWEHLDGRSYTVATPAPRSTPESLGESR